MADEVTKKWIQSAHLNKGGLHRALNIPEGQNIPMDKMKEAAQSNDEHLARMARFAMTARKF